MPKAVAQIPKQKTAPPERSGLFYFACQDLSLDHANGGLQLLQQHFDGLSHAHGLGGDRNRSTAAGGNGLVNGQNIGILSCPSKI